LEAELNLDPDSNLDPESDPELITDPDPNLQIISDPAGSGSGCTTLPDVLHSDPTWFSEDRRTRNCLKIIHILLLHMEEQKPELERHTTGRPAVDWD
jgi:hypothetical protein